MFEFKNSVGSYDIDTNCNATPTALVRFLMEAVDSNFLNCGPSYQELMSKGLSFIVSRAAIKVLRPLKEYEDFTVTTWATQSRSATFPRSFTVTASGETVAEAVTMWALVDVNNRKFLRGSEFDVTPYGTGDLLDIGLPTRFKLPELPLTHCGKTEVVYSLIDKNFHMNNTKYFDMLFDRIPNPQKFYMSSCALNYVSEAPFGSVIDVYISEPQIVGDETVYYFKTLIGNKTNAEAMIGVKCIEAK